MPVFNDLRIAARRLLARPGNSVLSIGILALGLGMTIFLFGAINSMVLSPLPFPAADRLVHVGEVEAGRIDDVDSIGADEWLAIAPHLDMFEAVAIDGGPATVNLSRANEVKRYDGGLIDAQILPMLGVQPLLGRGFVADDDRPGAALAVLLGERVWRNDFNADPAVIGQMLRANGEAATVVGVLPANFGFPHAQEVWLPRRVAAGDQFSVSIIGRLAPGVSQAQARQSLDTLATRLGSELDFTREGGSLGLEPLSHRFVNEITRRMVWMMFAAGVLVLLLACANVANLQLAQVLARRRELAVRSALGAGRARLLRDLFAEALLMSIVASAIGFLLAMLGGEWVTRNMAANQNLPAYFIDFGYTTSDAVFALAAAFLTCLLAGLLPALRAAGTDVQEALRDGAKGSQGGVFARISRALVVGEIALTVVLLVGAAMFVSAINGMLRLDFGTDTPPQQILTGRIGVFPQQYPTPADQYRYFERVVEALRADPQVIAATAGSTLPGSLSAGDDEVRVEGAEKPAGGDVLAEIGGVDAYFMDVYGVRLREGRFFDARDGADTLQVAVIDSQLAQQLWPQGNVLGQRLRLSPDDADAPLLTVVGVIDPLQLSETDDRRRPALLRPAVQSPTRFATVAVHVRGGDALAFAPRLGEIVRGVDADTPVYWQRTQAEAIRLGRAGPVLLTQLFSGVGVLALVLAASGLYGVLAFSVAQRTREIGIRRAIGAGARGVIGMVGRRIAWQVALGLGIGVALGLPWSAVLAEPVFNTRGYDPVIFGVVIATILLVATIASLAPLRRALRVDPLVALRQE